MVIFLIGIKLWVYKKKIQNHWLPTQEPFFQNQLMGIRMLINSHFYSCTVTLGELTKVKLHYNKF